MELPPTETRKARCVTLSAAGERTALRYFLQLTSDTLRVLRNALLICATRFAPSFATKRTLLRLTSAQIAPTLPSGWG